MIADIIEKIRPRTMADLMPPEVFAVANATGFGWAPVQYSYYWAIGRLLRPQVIFEIGVLGGVSLASMLMGAGARAIALGWDKEGYRADSNALAERAIRLCGLKNAVTLERRNSQEMATLPPTWNGIDLCHVDGEHGTDGALHDLELALSANIPTILFDDVFNVNTGAPAAAREFLRRHADRIVHYEVLPTTTGLMVIKLAP